MNCQSNQSTGGVCAVTVDPSTGDPFVPITPDVSAEFGKNSRTIKRWIANPDLGFPRPVRINGRLYVSRRALEAWKAAKLASALNGEAA